MYCPNCSEALVDAPNLLSQDKWGGDYYSHYCNLCKTYWHLHLSGEGVSLISTEESGIASKEVKENLVTELKARVAKLEE